jgi:hypothetical protein
MNKKTIDSIEKKAKQIKEERLAKKQKDKENIKFMKEIQKISPEIHKVSPEIHKGIQPIKISNKNEKEFQRLLEEGDKIIKKKKDVKVKEMSGNLKANTYILKVPSITDFINSLGSIVTKPTMNEKGKLTTFNKQISFITEEDESIKVPKIVKNEDYDKSDYIVDKDEKTKREESLRAVIINSFANKILKAKDSPSQLSQLNGKFYSGSSKDRNQFRIDFINKKPSYFNVINTKYPLEYEMGESNLDAINDEVDAIRDDIISSSTSGKSTKAIEKTVEKIRKEKMKNLVKPVDKSIYGNLERTVDKLKQTKNKLIIEFQQKRLENLIKYNPEYEVIKDDDNYKYIMGLRIKKTSS